MVSGLLVSLADEITPGAWEQVMPMRVQTLLSADRRGVAVLGQEPSAFPLDRPVVDGDAIYLLRGYAWGDGSFPPDEAPAIELVRRMGRSLVSNGHLFPDGHNWSGLFTLAALTPHAIHVASDPAGLFPVYCWSQPGRALLSSHERVIARLVGAPADMRGVVQTAAFGYTIGERTMHRGIRQLAAGASARMDRASGTITVSDHPGLYGPVEEGIAADQIADAIWDDYLDGVRHMTTLPGRAGMLMSGGFDTRLVALGFRSVDRDIVALTIGDEDNYEVGVARRVAELSSADWARRTAQPDLDALEEGATDMLAHAESLCFPTCEFGGAELAARGATTLSTGYGGETVLGGQGGTKFLGAGSRGSRLLDVLRRGARSAPDRRVIERHDLGPMVGAITQHHQAQLAMLGNRVASGLTSEVEQATAEIRAEIETELERLLGSGPTALEQVGERFWLEHHVRKHFGRQELTLDRHLPLLLPTLSTRLFLRLATVDPHLKVDHGVYLRVIRRHFGDYARIPTSNVPVPLTMPTPVIWAARSARALWDDRQTAVQLRTKGEKGKRYGWSNYEVWARESTLFEQLPRLIDPWLINPDWLARKLAKQASWQEKFHSGQEHLLYATISGLVEP